MVRGGQSRPAVELGEASHAQFAACFKKHIKSSETVCPDTDTWGGANRFDRGGGMRKGWGWDRGRLECGLQVEDVRKNEGGVGGCGWVGALGPP
eukprot:3099097-Pyramimonas_sp.AAC.1